MNPAVVRRLITILLCFVVLDGYCQPGTTVELDKPKQYQNRTLASEKTGDKKFNLKRHIYQNMVTHYNYYFNANNHLNDIIDKAKLNFRDDYTQLLPFYNYSLDVTAQDQDIDSVIYKCNAGIFLHDLRNDWIDNMYLLMGKAYYYRKNFDSATAVFQYINYAFAPKEDGYFVPIGSNASKTEGVFTVATKEDRNIVQKLTTQPPSRNDALLWQAKNYTEAGKFGEAAGLLQILRIDPLFPARLQTDLDEALAYWCYKQKMYDSAAAHLSKAVTNVENRQERARREFLTAQLYLLANNNEEAIKWYDRAAEHTLDPVMEVYANLNSINAYPDKSDSLLQQKVKNLLKLAHKEKYLTNRDIIYYALAQIEVQRNDIPDAKQYLLKSTQYSVTNPQQKSRSFLMLADISYDTKNFIPAKNYYDSIAANYLATDDDKNRVQLRIGALKIITQGLAAIHVEDSLQAIAAMPKAEQDIAIKKAVKQLRKLQGLKDDENSTPNFNPAIKGDAATSDLFASAPNNGSATTDWYFNNPNLKGQGYNSFRTQWGNRPNVDNWRRQSAVDKSLAVNNAKNQAKQDSIENAGGGSNAGQANNSSSYDALYKNLPVTPELLKASNDKITKALFTNAQAFQNKLEDYSAAIDTYDTLNLKYPGNSYEEEALFNLYYCYTKLGRNKQADSVKSLMARSFPKGKFTQTIQTGPVAIVKATDAATQKYHDIYNLFIEGRFEEAKNQKATADSIYGKSHWTPQLLFIEAIYYVSKRQDSVAINRLNSLSKMYPSSPMAAKAATMISVLQRRTEIEGYLTALQITRLPEDAPAPIVFATTPTETTTSVKSPVARVNKDSVAKISNPVAPLKLDTMKTATGVLRKFEFNAADSQYVTILLDKVDPVFATEAGNAFNRFNSTTFYSQRLKTTTTKLDDRYSLVLVGPFKDAATAVDYVNKVRPVSGSRIVPWLAAEKYTFTMISPTNLALLKDIKDVDGYKALLQKVLPGQF